LGGPFLATAALSGRGQRARPGPGALDGEVGDDLIGGYAAQEPAVRVDRALVVLEGVGRQLAGPAVGQERRGDRVESEAAR
jgi:hypothetical protein